MANKTQPGLYDLPITWPSFVCCWTPQLLLVPKSEFDAFLHVFATERWARHFQVAGPLSSKRLLLGKWVVLCPTINCPIKLTWIVLPWIYDFIITTIPGFFVYVHESPRVPRVRKSTYFMEVISMDLYCGIYANIWGILMVNVTIYGGGSKPINYILSILVGWTSIYKLFWGSPGVQAFDP